jgi:hypothetical protein
VDFEEVAERASSSTIEGVGVRLVSLPDFITAMQFADRGKDHDPSPSWRPSETHLKTPRAGHLRREPQLQEVQITRG